MKVLESTADRLRLLFLGWGVAGIICDFDRRKNAAEIIRFVTVVPYRRERVALSEITGVQLNKRNHVRLLRYTQVFRLRHGSRMHFSCSGKNEAIEATRLIRSFLNITA